MSSPSLNSNRLHEQDQVTWLSNELYPFDASEMAMCDPIFRLLGVWNHSLVNMLSLWILAGTARFVTTVVDKVRQHTCSGGPRMYAKKRAIRSSGSIFTVDRIMSVNQIISPHRRQCRKSSKAIASQALKIKIDYQKHSRLT